MKSFFYRLLLAMAILMPFVGQTQLCNDPSEPNATMGQAFDLGELTNTPLQNDSLCLTAGDQDFFQFRHSGTQYFVRVRGFSNNTQGRYGITVRLDSSFISVNTRSINGSRTDTYLYLLDVNSLVLGENDDINRTLFSEVRYNFINPIFLSANPTQLNLAPTNDSTSFVVTASNVNWTITAPTWLTLSTTTGGNGSTTVRVMATNNNTNRERLGYISVNGSNSVQLYG
jgi:hypothetical protein